MNHESLQQYNHFRETMLRQITLAKMKRRRRSDSPGKAAAAAVAAATAAATAANSGGGSACNSANTSAGSPMNMSEDEKSMTVSAPCSPASSLQMINSCARPSLAALSSNTPVSSAAATASKRKREEIKDEAYWERRKKNNEAAKRSRDARRAKEDEIAIRAAFLEQENIQLKWEVATLKTETCRLKALLLNDSALDRIGTSGSAAAAAAAAAVAASSSAPASPERH